MSRPDEGLIHAWLDGELDAAEAARVARLANDDPEWAAAVAEARGFIAASDRILGALDDVPARVIPATPNADAGGSRSGGIEPAGSGSRSAPPNARSPRGASVARGAPDARGARGARALPWWALRAAAVLVVVAGVAVVMRRGPEVAMETGQSSAGLPPLPSARGPVQAAAPPAQQGTAGGTAATAPKDLAAAAKLKASGVARSAATPRAAVPPAVANELARDEPTREPAAPGARAANAAAVASAVQAPAVAGAAAEADRARQVEFRGDAAKTVGAVAALARVACYRIVGGTDTLRVQLLTDSTAVDARAQSGVEASAGLRSNAAREMRVRGDTLFAGFGPGTLAALKVTCPRP
jgi:hypothetical protein